MCSTSRSEGFTKRRPPIFVPGSSQTTWPIASMRSRRFKENQNCRVWNSPSGAKDSNDSPDSEMLRIFPPSSPQICMKPRWAGEVLGERRVFLDMTKQILHFSADLQREGRRRVAAKAGLRGFSSIVVEPAIPFYLDS